MSGETGRGHHAEAFPLTEIQYAYWVGRGPNFILGNVAPHAYFELEGRTLDPEVLATAWRRLVDRHPMLRTVVDESGAQRVLPTAPEFTLAFEDLSGVTPDDREARLAARRAEMSARVYDPAAWPLFDIAISRLPDHDRLHISLDLLIVDLAGITVLFDEWNTLCREPRTELPPIDITFRDYVTALEKGAGKPRYQRSMEYWTSRARTIAPPPDLPLAKSPVDIRKPAFSHREFHLPPEDWQRIQERASGRGLTPTAVLATVFAQTLRTWSGTPRFTLNLTLFNRLPLLLSTDERGRRRVHPHLSRMVGEFTSICLLEMDTTGDLSLSDQVRRTQYQLQQDLRHRHVSALQTLREQRRQGLQNGFMTMPVVFTSGLGTVTDVTDALDYFGEMTYRLSQTPQVWLDHQVVDIDGSLNLTWDAVEELFPDGLLDDMFDAYCHSVARLAHDEDAWGRQPAVPVPGHQLALRQKVNETADVMPDRLLHEGLAHWAEHAPDRPAVISGGTSYSYGELHRRSLGVADAVAPHVTATLAEESLVAVTLPKSMEQIAAVCGILLAGGAYLSVGPSLPVRRRHDILADSGAVAVVTGGDLATGLAWPAELPRLVVPAPGPAEPHPADRPAPDRRTAPGDLAYVLYTSGSTGAPKGVMIEHRGACNTIADINRRFGVGPDARILGLADLSFDLSVYDVFGTFQAGGTLVLPDDSLRAEPAHWAELMSRHGVTVWNSVPAQMEMLVDHLESGAPIPAGLRLVLLSGDWVPLDLPGRIASLWPDAQVISLGGATEASIWSNWHPADQVPDGLPSVPYGKPLANQAFHVLDERLSPCPVWVQGELYIAGAGLARGYWGDPQRTAASFITHPETGECLYRTGDYGRYLPDGTLQFLGRRDGQVKINGHRVECGEIEGVLAGHPGVDRAVVVKSEAAGGAARLLGYVVPDSQDTSLVRRTTVEPYRAERWRRAVRPTADVRPAGPGADQLTAAWAALDELYAEAVAVAFRSLGLAGEPGDVVRTGATATAGVAARYDRWVRRAVGVLTERGVLRDTPEGHEVVHPLPEALPPLVVDRARAALSGTMRVTDELADWMLSLAGSLAEILTQSLHSAELYASDRTPDVYRLLFDTTYRVAAEYTRRFVDAWPDDRPLRVMEVGAGYGTLTQRILPLFPADRTDYFFTDISPYFTDRARHTFAEYPFVRYGMYDLDRDPEPQGYEDLSADLIIAASVLHDTGRIDETLTALRSALAPGGMLLIVEQTRFHPWFDLLMGLQQGFDVYEDTELRVEHPLLDRAQWAERLAAAGFDGSDVLTPTGGPAAAGFDVLVAHGPLIRDRYDMDALRAYAAERLPQHMLPAHLFRLARLPLTPTGKIDRKALSSVQAQAAGVGRQAVPPTTDRQFKLVAIYRDVLSLSDMDLAVDFLDAGGDSLLAARISAELLRAFGVTVPVAAVLQQPTVAAIDQWLERMLGPSTEPAVATSGPTAQETA
ncbi:amino acid adenylation domain-containing protein [Streptomyces sp. NPDC021098]|uniref:non-ribosomal peptide synthetase n=1 Tax=unclassified Streptomyces TaxID=2593676 RepID=UPI003795BCD4